MKNKPTVLMVVTEYPPFTLGGVGTHAQELVAGLAGLGCQVYVITLTPNESSIVRAGNVTVCFLPVPQGARFSEPGMIKYWSDFFAKRALAAVQEVCSITPDLVHCQGWG